ncbi:MAG: phosphotransferase [Clostridia bacterium]|nr:phosphotransferase [Clostridia bacterium]
MELTYQAFCLLNDLYDRARGRTVLPSAEGCDEAALLPRLAQEGLVTVNPPAITQKGEEALEPYRVKGAVILAAGPSTRFIPLSLEQPKGLFEVKGERLIERQIKQLREAGITDITVVLGYKAEMFFYLRDKYDVRFVFNERYSVKNNIESIRLAGDALCDAYLCCCDHYLTVSPFRTFEYRSFNAGIATADRINEMYVTCGEDGRILSMRPGENGGTIMAGHVFWTADFAEAFLRLAEEDLHTGIYDHMFWEWMVKDQLEQLPPLYMKKYGPDCIFEFDYFEELRRFDDAYLGETHSRIMGNIAKVFGCSEKDIIGFRNISEGLTNTSFVFRIGDEDYIYRHPGDGTANIISRENERRSLEIARERGIDPTFICADVQEGWKISRYVPVFREPDYASETDSEKVVAMLRRLHSLPVKVDYGLRPWEDALAMEALLRQKDPNCMAPFEGLKAKIHALYEKTLGDGVQPCFCHGDTYCHNWMLKPDGDVILIDWEYAGYADPGVDVGYYIVDAMYDFDTAERFILAYLEGNRDETLMFHYMAYTALIAWYWFVWAMYRESCGAVMGESLYNWYEMARKYAEHLCAE